MTRGVGDRLASARLQVWRALLLLWTIGRLGLLPAVRHLLRLRQRGPAVPVRIRLGLERLGLTYLKLGQYLAMRFDILPADVCRELGKLFEDVPPMPFGDVCAIIQQELGGPPDQVFASFDPHPLAAASVAQVHRAWTRSNERVAVKVQRLGIEDVFRADINNLRRLTAVADAMHLLGRMSTSEMLDQFARWTLKETNFELEGRTADLVHAKAADFEVIPRVYWDLTSRRVLTLEFIDGVSLASLAQIADSWGPDEVARRHPEIDVEAVLHNMVVASLRQIFVNGRFHGDPHPGNILVLDDSRVAFIDFGIFGELTRYDRQLLAGQIENLAVGNIDASLRAYTKQLGFTQDSDVRAFRREARQTLAEWYAVSLRPESPVAERHVGRYVGRMIDISRRYQMTYDMSYLLYWRALNALHSTCLRLSSDYELVADLRAFFERVRPSPLERVRDAVGDLSMWSAVADLAHRGPGRAPEVKTSLREGRRSSSLQIQESVPRRRSRERQARLLVAGVALLGLLVLAVHLLPLLRLLPSPVAGLAALGALTGT